jgi:hypothetical protein
MSDAAQSSFSLTNALGSQEEGCRMWVFWVAVLHVCKRKCRQVMMLGASYVLASARLPGPMHSLHCDGRRLTSQHNDDGELGAGRHQHASGVVDKAY